MTFYVFYAVFLVFFYGFYTCLLLREHAAVKRIAAAADRLEAKEKELIKLIEKFNQFPNE